MLRLITKAQSTAHVLKRKLRKYVSDDSGATAIEYGLIAAGIAVAIIAAVFAIGDELDNLFTAIQTKLASNYS